MTDSCTISALLRAATLPKCPESIASDVDAILSRFDDWDAREKLAAYEASLSSEQERTWARGYINDRLCADIGRLTRALGRTLRSRMTGR